MLAEIRLCRACRSWQGTLIMFFEDGLLEAEIMQNMGQKTYKFLHPQPVSASVKHQLTSEGSNQILCSYTIESQGLRRRTQHFLKRNNRYWESITWQSSVQGNTFDEKSQQEHPGSKGGRED